ncbi:restriction endonuclease subunit S, partial [Bifidobacterium catenulatum]
MAEQHGKALVPQIRFAGFTDPWEQRKLGELFEEHSEKDRDDLPALTIIQGGGTVHRDESKRNLQFDRSSLSNYKVVDTGDFIVHLRSFEGGLEKATCYGLVSPAYHIFRGKNVDSDFYYLYFRSKRFIDVDLKPHVYGIRDGRSIDIEGMKTIFIPWTNLAEQRQIGAFFDRLNSLITLHQRKCDKLCVLKKSMLDKMFPKGGSLYPEIRFAGFTDPWEQRKLGELFEEHSEKDRDDLPALTIIQGGGTVHRDESKRNLQFDRSSLSNYKVVDTGDFIVHLRSFEGGLEKATCYGLVSPAYHIFRGKNVDSDFYYLYFRSKRFIDVDLKPHVYGIRDGRSIDIEGMKTIFIPWTNLAEQRQIGAFFDRLNSLITLHQRK